MLRLDSSDVAVRAYPKIFFVELGKFWVYFTGKNTLKSQGSQRLVESPKSCEQINET